MTRNCNWTRILYRSQIDLGNHWWYPALVTTLKIIDNILANTKRVSPHCIPVTLSDFQKQKDQKQNQRYWFFLFHAFFFPFKILAPTLSTTQVNCKQFRWRWLCVVLSSRWPWNLLYSQVKIGHQFITTSFTILFGIHGQ